MVSIVIYLLISNLLSLSYSFPTTPEYVSPTTASQIHSRQADPDGPIIQVVALSDDPSDTTNQLGDIGQPIDSQSFFSVHSDCYSDTRDMENSGFPNRGKFFEQAYRDATAIAYAAEKWPQLGTDASDLYFGVGTDDEKYAVDIAANIKAAAEWDHSRFGFDNYIVLSCSDDFNACGGHIANDPRSIACYANNTRSWWWNKSVISCCSTFFLQSTIAKAKKENDGRNSENLDLRFLQTSGSFLLHEMLHTLEITGTHPKTARPHITDQLFDGGRGIRIYGPKDVAKAARTMSKDITTKNADSYAQFMSAMYWKDVYNGALPQPSTTDVAPAGWIDAITDTDTNYVTLELPADPPKHCADASTGEPSVLQPYAQEQIARYCSFVSTNNVVIDSGVGKYNPVGYPGGDTLPQSLNDLWISVSFDPICNTNTSYTIDESECNFLLGVTLNGCSTDTVTEKFGGQVQSHCALWNMTTRAGHDDTPPNGFPVARRSKTGTTYPPCINC